MKYNIKNSTLVDGHFEAVSEDGKPFVGTGGKIVYPSAKGLMIALSRAGHDYPGKGEKKEVSTEGRLNLTDDQILGAYDLCKSKIPEGTKVYTDADAMAKKLGFQNYFTLGKKAAGIRWGRKSEAERAEVKAKVEAFKAKAEVRAVTPADDSLTEAQRVFRNVKAKEHGFDSYRAVRRAADKGDAKAVALRTLIQAQVRELGGASVAQPVVAKADPLAELNAFMATSKVA